MAQSNPDPLWRQIDIDLNHLTTDDQAYGRLLRTKREIIQLAKNPKYANQLLVKQLEAKLVDIPDGATCTCCGYEGLVNIRRREGQIVGPECVNHPIGTCGGRKA